MRYYQKVKVKSTFTLAFIFRLDFCNFINWYWVNYLGIFQLIRWDPDFFLILQMNYINIFQKFFFHFIYIFLYFFDSHIIDWDVLAWFFLLNLQRKVFFYVLLKNLPSFYKIHFYILKFKISIYFIVCLNQVFFNILKILRAFFLLKISLKDLAALNLLLIIQKRFFSFFVKLIWKIITSAFTYIIIFYYIICKNTFFK